MKILFVDVDGTLIDSFPGIRASFLHALEEMNWPVPTEERISQIPGPPMEWTMQDLGMTAEQAKQALEIYLEHYGHTGWKMSSAFPGLKEFLAWARGRGYMLCTATSKGEYFARITLEHHGLIQYFDFLGAAEENGARRSKAAVIDYVMESMKLHGRESDILMIGDRIHDIEGASQFGIETVAVEWGYGTPEEHAQAAFCANDPQDLERIVKEWSHEDQKG